MKLLLLCHSVILFDCVFIIGNNIYKMTDSLPKVCDSYSLNPIITKKKKKVNYEFDS